MSGSIWLNHFLNLHKEMTKPKQSKLINPNTSGKVRVKNKTKTTKWEGKNPIYDLALSPTKLLGSLKAQLYIRLAFFFFCFTDQLLYKYNIMIKV